MFPLGTIGTGAQLVLLEHTEDAWQLVPLVIAVAGAAAIGFVAASPRRATVRLFQATMALFVASGAAGVLLHYDGNIEFELEMRPTGSGLTLFWEALTGATPTLAPGIMSLLGALRFVYAYGYPAAPRHRDRREREN